MRCFIGIPAGAFLVMVTVMISGGLLSCAPREEPQSTTSGQASANNCEYLESPEGVGGRLISYDDMFYRGGSIYNHKGMQHLYMLGVRNIISVEPSEEERAMCKKFGIRLIELPFEKNAIPTAVIDSFLVTVQNMNAPLYVHGEDNDARSGILGVVYRIYMYKWPFLNAVEEFIALGGDTGDDSLLIASLRTYDSRRKQARQ